jgi:hypothetical protein
MDYCVSTFDTDPFEPQPDPVSTIFPFVVRRKPDAPASSPPSRPAFLPPSFVSSPPPSVQASQPPSFFVELPYTLVQDFNLFIILGEKTIDIWKQKLDWIARSKGMVLLNSHPDYKNFGDSGFGWEEYPVQLYRDFLEYVRSQYCGQYWPALPQHIWSFCTEHFQTD